MARIFGTIQKMHKDGKTKEDMPKFIMNHSNVTEEAAVRAISNILGTKEKNNEPIGYK